MNLPTIPSNFSSGEVLTADRMNQILDWMRSVSSLLPGLELSTGQGLRISKTPSGTVLALDPNANGADFSPPHPFHVRVLYDENATPAGIAISGGGVFITVYTASMQVGDLEGLDYDRFNLNKTSSFYKDPEIKHGNPVGLSLYLVTQGEDAGEFILSANDPEQEDGLSDNLFVKIAEFKAGNNGLVLVSQILRSDIFFPYLKWEC